MVIGSLDRDQSLLFILNDYLVIYNYNFLKDLIHTYLQSMF